MSWREILLGRCYYGRRNWVDGTTMFSRLIEERLGKHSIVLDLGAGKGKAGYSFRDRASFVVGIDTDPNIKANRLISARIQADIGALPFQSGAFNLIYSDYVLEHVQEPITCIREVARVLAPGGYFIFRTPNLFHYVSMISLLTPHWFHQLIANRVRGIAEDDENEVYPTVYRMNTRWRVEHVCRTGELEPETLMMVEREPSYMLFNPAAFILGFLYERVVNRFESLQAFRSNIFGVFRKPSPG